MQHLPPPQIDIGPLLSASDDRAVQQVHAEIADACKNWGFFNIVNHGVDPELVSKFEEMTRHFFSLPKEVKNSVRRTVTNSRGYFDDEYTQQKIDWKEGFDFGDTDNEVDGSSVWPEGEEEFKSVMLKYFATMKKLSEVILGLGQPRDALKPFFGEEHTSFLRLNRYPPCPTYDKDLGVSPHKDAGVLTILKHDDEVSGLQVYMGEGDGLTRDDPGWVTVPPIPGGFTVNIGDMAQVWSNDVYKAGLHRVLATKDKERISMPFFYNPSLQTTIEPFAETPEQRKYKPINWGNFRRSRFLGDYADVGEEVQISHFRV
eukprot:TRINITY_DN372_c0_g1_i2.p1 TRINITY_DN372_c0_g1~~TRINITY_DN372_c0_g1_i2.p1  ORF type:complete len:316 (-),score=58.59 TRINITY_DN372_c0_g1_i2:68-1015(-)